MKILIYTHTFAPKVGGVQTYIMLLAQCLAKGSYSNDLRVTVVTPTPAGDWNDASLPFRVVRQPRFVELVRLIAQADVIHLAGPSFLPMLSGLLLRKPVVVEHSGYQACCPNGLLIDERTRTVCPNHFMARRYAECLGCNRAAVGWMKSVRKLLLAFPRRWLCARVARNVGPSVHVCSRIGLPRTATIHHGVPVLPPASAQLDLPVSFAYVGRLVWEKGVPVLLAAAQQLMARGYDFRLKIIGDGPDRSNLEGMTDQYGLRSTTTFAGFLRGQALLGALEGVHSTIMPSICEDVAPLAAIEQMIQGRLLIASDIGGLGELVDGVGLKFTPGDVGLASCLERILKEPGLATNLGGKARRVALEGFTETRMAAQHFALYTELVDAHPPIATKPARC